MAITSYPIYAGDITALSKPDSPVSVEVQTSANLDRPLAHGWLTSAAVQPGFNVFAARYDSREAYTINTTADPGFVFSLNLGDGDSGGIPGRELYLPSGNSGAMSIDEPVPIRMDRGQRRHLERCGISLGSEWIESGMFERFDDTGIVGKTVARRGISETAAASPALLSAASRLFAAFNFDCPLAGLRREAAALAFFAEAFTGAEETQRPRPASRIEIGRIRHVKDVLDSLAPDMDVRLVELAAHHGMSVRSLCRHFRQTFGTTVLGYVAGRRMEHARAALGREGLTIDQAAYIAGFAHTSNFSSAFRRRYGYPPGNARGKHHHQHHAPDRMDVDSPLTPGGSADSRLSDA